MQQSSQTPVYENVRQFLRQKVFRQNVPDRTQAKSVSIETCDTISKEHRNPRKSMSPPHYTLTKSPDYEHIYSELESDYANEIRFGNSNKTMQSHLTSGVEKTFYEYSVQEVVECFSQCSLKKLADFCMKEKLDGLFFKDFDLEKFGTEPLCLDHLSITKVKKIVLESWRPKL